MLQGISYNNMNQELTIPHNQYNSNNAILRSHKILNSPSNFHLKTEQDRNQDDKKSPEQGKPQFRQTSWRKPRMPYKKFPDAFQMRDKRNSTNRRMDVEEMRGKEQSSEQKKVKGLLNPISLEKQHKNKYDEDEDNNPFRAVQKYIQLKNQFSSAAQKIEREKTPNKYKTVSVKLSSQSFKIGDCITLKVIKRGHNTGTLKKMLHVPNLQLVCVRQQPLNTKESRNSIKQWVQFWQNKLNNQASNRFIKIYGIAFNYPQGAVSIMTQYYEEGSLLDLLNVILTLPESVIRNIFEQVCISLKLFYQITERQFGGLSPSQILLTKNGVKLGMGLYYHFSNINSGSIYHLKTPNRVANIFQMNMTQKNFMKKSLSKPQNLQIERALDIFKLGLIVLQCAIGGFQNFEQSTIIHDILKIVFSEQGQKTIEKDNVCCLIHSEHYLLEWAVSQDRIKKQQFQIDKVLLYIRFLKERFSMSFMSFLCQSLKLVHSKRATINDLLQHAFLFNENKECRTVNVDLQDLMQISNYQSDTVIQSIKQERLDKFISHIMQVLVNCNREVLIGLTKNSKDRILGLSKYIGVMYKGLGQNLLNLINDLIKSYK